MRGRIEDLLREFVARADDAGFVVVVMARKEHLARVRATAESSYLERPAHIRVTTG